MAPSATSTSPKSFILPDLVSHCDFTLRVSRHRKQVTVETKKWLFQGDNLVGEKRHAFHGLNAGLLTAMTYPDAACPQLKLCNDFLTFLFHLDNLSDDMDNRGTHSIANVVLNSLYHPYTYRCSARVGRMTRDLYKRMLLTASPGAQQRFTETMDFFFQSITQQAKDRAAGVIPDLESYIALRRDTSGCKPCWALIEYANNLDIPDEVMDHPTIRALGEATNDLVTWSNDIFSYNVEQSKGDTHNMIVVAMSQRGLDLQSAVDFVGEMCKGSIDRFKRERDSLPSWGPEIDRQVKMYVQGLADWIVGSLHWSFESTRYFGTNGRKIKTTRFVELLPLRPEARARALSIRSQPTLPQIKIPAAAQNSNSSTPTDPEPVTPSDGANNIPLLIIPSPKEPAPRSPLPILHITTNVAASPSKTIQTLGESLPSSAVESPSIQSGWVDLQPLSPEIFSPAVGLANHRVVRNGPLAEPFNLYSLTIWVFVVLVYQPAMALLGFFINQNLHLQPFSHYEYM